jgi:hypothetical protein
MGRMRDLVPEPVAGIFLHHVAMDDCHAAVTRDEVGRVEGDLVDELAVVGNGPRSHRSSQGASRSRKRHACCKASSISAFGTDG